jgi:hypothetical protein
MRKSTFFCSYPLGFPLTPVDRTRVVLFLQFKVGLEIERELPTGYASFVNRICVCSEGDVTGYLTLHPMP